MKDKGGGFPLICEDCGEETEQLYSSINDGRGLCEFCFENELKDEK